MIFGVGFCLVVRTHPNLATERPSSLGFVESVLEDGQLLHGLETVDMHLRERSVAEKDALHRQPVSRAILLKLGRGAGPIRGLCIDR
jgi:hypothetical protein